MKVMTSLQKGTVGRLNGLSLKLNRQSLPHIVIICHHLSFSDVVNFGVGPPTTSDVDLAATFKCLIYCFNLRVPGAIETLAKNNGVEILHFNIIYRLFEHMKVRELRTLAD